MAPKKGDGNAKNPQIVDLHVKKGDDEQPAIGKAIGGQ